MAALPASIPERGMLAPLALGYAVAGTDDGHQDTVNTDASWALNHPEKVIDFGYRAMKETTDAAKAIITANKGTQRRAIPISRAAPTAGARR